MFPTWPSLTLQCGRGILLLLGVGAMRIKSPYMAFTDIMAGVIMGDTTPAGKWWDSSLQLDEGRSLGSSYLAFADRHGATVFYMS